jgi:hypothetical protein
MTTTAPSNSAVLKQLTQYLTSGHYASAFALAAKTGTMDQLTSAGNLSKLMPQGLPSQQAFSQFYAAFAPYEKTMQGTASGGSGYQGASPGMDKVVWGDPGNAAKDALDNWNAATRAGGATALSNAEKQLTVAPTNPLQAAVRNGTMMAPHGGQANTPYQNAQDTIKSIIPDLGTYMGSDQTALAANRASNIGMAEVAGTALAAFGGAALAGAAAGAGTGGAAAGTAAGASSGVAPVTDASLQYGSLLADNSIVPGAVADTGAAAGDSSLSIAAPDISGFTAPEIGQPSFLSQLSAYTPKNLISSGLQSEGVNPTVANITGGAVQGSGVSTAEGQNPVTGAVTGGIGSGVSPIANEALGTVGGSAATSAATGAAGAALNGGNALTGAEFGAVSGGASGGVNAAGSAAGAPSWLTSFAAPVAASAATGAVRSSFGQSGSGLSPPSQGSTTMGNMSAGQGSFYNSDGTINWNAVGTTVGNVGGAAYGAITANNPKGSTMASPSWLTNAFTNNISAGQAFYKSAPVTYGGPLTASLSPEEQAGIAGAKPLANGVNPADVQSWLNPYTTNVVDTTNTQLNRQRQLELGQVDSNAQAAGAFGGDRQSVAEGITNQNADMALASTDASLENTGYQTAVSDAFQNNQAKLAGNQNEIAAGQLQTNQAQTADTNAYNAWQTSNAQRIANLNALYASTSNPSGVRGVGTQTPAKGSPLVGAVLGGSNGVLGQAGGAIFSGVKGLFGGGGSTPPAVNGTQGMPGTVGFDPNSASGGFNFGTVPGVNSSYNSGPSNAPTQIGSGGYFDADGNWVPG